MGSLLDLSGRRFGRLIVQGIAGRTSSGGATWVCNCECGTTKTIPSDHLVRAIQPVLSCGCYRNDQVRKSVTPPDDCAFNLLFASYKKRAKMKSRAFALTVDQFKRITKERCVYCGNEPSSIAYNKPKTGLYVYNGIDRINTAEGYVIANCAPCCARCNYMKLDMNASDFLSHVARIATFQEASP